MEKDTFNCLRNRLFVEFGKRLNAAKGYKGDERRRGENAAFFDLEARCRRLYEELRGRLEQRPVWSDRSPF